MKRNLHAGKRQSGGFSLNVFTEDELYEIHLATLEVLQRTGIFVEDEVALEIFDGGGAEVDRKAKIVKIPPYIVEDAVRSAPSKLFLAGRDPKNDIVLESNRVHFTGFAVAVQLLDPYTGEIRKPTKADIAAAAIMEDYLSEVDVNQKAMDALDVPQEVLALHNAEALFPNTTKHCFIGAGNGKQQRKLIEMAAVIAGGEDKLRSRPLASFHTCPVSPLKLVRESCEVIMECARSGMVIDLLSMAMAGGSSPVHLAGTLVTHNAEVLSGIVLDQLTRKGAPVMYGSSTTAMDLRLATASVGSPECGMISAAVAQMAQYYQIPSWVAGG
ncbi:MAG: hypothetical protein GTN74_05285 [Proteobacteria bacterium]|nr:hypothetical protein [Pseudomonadota bacterium]NIS68904.1 hypothetical protein [Pseudomonadota bacterium]